MIDPDTLITMMDEFDVIAAKYGYQIGIASSKEDDEDNTIIRIMLEPKDAEG